MDLVPSTHTRVPLLSVVIPVHRVARYLTECLDSVLAGAGDEVEVVAVDDASPDGSGELLERYAQRDHRVHVVRLAANVGLGRARNAGLDRATGEYVWFVDGDDRVPAGSVPAVLARLVAARPDVLLVGHAELHPDGRVVPAPLPRSGVPARLAERPELLAAPLATSACTKVVRRAFLAGTGLRFPPGWYEDCAYAYPLLLAVDRIDALDRVCYHYRRRGDGAITSSVSGRHFDIFEQYDRMWAWVQTAPGHAELVPELFGRMVDHLLVVAGNEHRLPPPQRRAFFHRLARQYRRHLPPGGYRLPAGTAGLKHRLVRRDAYPAYALLRLAWRLTRSRRGAGRAAAPVPAGQPSRGASRTAR